MPESKIPDCELCAFQSVPDKCVYFDCLNSGHVEKSPTVQDQLIKLYEHVLAQDFKSFLIAVCHAAVDKPGLSDKAKLRTFREHYQESDIIFIPAQQEAKQQKKGPGIDI